MAQKDCPQCEGTGWKPIEVNGIRRVTRCDCQNLEHSALLLKQAHIPPRYEHCELEEFSIRKIPGTDQENPSLERFRA